MVEDHRVLGGTGGVLIESVVKVNLRKRVRILEHQLTETRGATETRRGHKSGSTGCKVLWTKPKAARWRSSSRFVGRGDLVNNTLCFVVAKSWAEV